MVNALCIAIKYHNQIRLLATFGAQSLKFIWKSLTDETVRRPLCRRRSYDSKVAQVPARFLEEFPRESFVLLIFAE